MDFSSFLGNPYGFSMSDLSGQSNGGTDWGFDSNRSKTNWLGGSAAAFFSPSLGNYLSAAESRQAQEYAMNQQHKWQVEENQRDREFQLLMMNQQYQMANDYSYLAAQLRAAGINPSSYFGQNNVSPASPTASAPSRGYSGAGFAGAVGGSGPSFFTTIAQMMDSMSKVKTTSLAEERQKATLSAEVDKLLSEASNQSANAEFISTQNQIKKSLGYSREAVEILRINNEAYAASARGDYDKAAALNQEAMAKLNGIEAQTKQELKPILLANQQKLGKVYDSEREKNVAQAGQARAAAKREQSQSLYLDALSETENQLRDGSVRGQRLTNDLKEIQSYIAGRDRVLYEATFHDKLSAMVAQLERERLINKEMAEKIRKLQTDNDWNGVEHAIGAVSSAVGSMSNLGNLELNQWSTSQRLDIQRRAVENMRRPKSVLEQKNLHGNYLETYTEYEY